jgi:hypothetical protein
MRPISSPSFSIFVLPLHMSLHRSNFQKPHGQYSDYFARFYGSLLFAFAVASTVLSSMQVEMAVDQASAAQGVVLWSVCRWTSTVILVATVLIISSWILAALAVVVLLAVEPSHASRSAVVIISQQLVDQGSQ